MNALTPLNQQLSGPMPAPVSASPAMANPRPMPQSPATRVGGTSAYFPTNEPPSQPLGQQMAAQGRGPDSMLVHMAPEEVGGLQQLALAAGGSLTINPVTGLPEAGFLKKLLPTLLGAALTPLTGGIINPMTAGLIVGAGYGLKSGNLKKGLMAGLQAYGGAGLSSSLLGTSHGLFGMGGAAAPGAAAPGAAASGATAQAATAPSTAGLVSSQNAVQAMNANLAGAGAAPGAAGLGAGASAVPVAAPSHLMNTQPANILKSADLVRTAGAPDVAMRSGLRGAYSNFGDALRQGVPGGIPRSVTTGLGTMGLMSAASGALGGLKPGALKGPEPEKSKYPYMGPYTATPRKVRFKPPGYDPNDSSEFQYFEDVNPNPGVLDREGNPPPGYPAYIPPPAPRMAAGGLVALKPGGFVLDARTVSEVGNGSSDAGREALAKYGGQHVEGKGDGVSDSIGANIRGGPRAKVARDEVKFSPQAVKRLGGGDTKRGAQKLYSLMEQARMARQTARRGDDTGLRRTLGA